MQTPNFYDFTTYGNRTTHTYSTYYTVVCLTISKRRFLSDLKIIFHKTFMVHLGPRKQKGPFLRLPREKTSHKPWSFSLKYVSIAIDLPETITTGLFDSILWMTLVNCFNAKDDARPWLRVECFSIDGLKIIIRFATLAALCNDRINLFLTEDDTRR